MRGDFSRTSFDRTKHYSGVRMQQGRVQLDADWNEHVDILHHQHTTQLSDLLGAVGAPATTPGFAIALPTSSTTNGEGGDTNDRLPPDVRIAFGHRYVEGILCTNDAVRSDGSAASGTTTAAAYNTFLTQPDFPGAAAHRAAVAGHDRYLVYLDVWQQHITALEDAELLEVALDGLDTTTRTKTIAQVKFWRAPTPGTPSASPDGSDEDELVAAWNAFQQEVQATPGSLAVRKAEYGIINQNQLYRVEIQSVENGLITYKWSRENGAIAYAVAKVSATNTEEFIVQLAEIAPGKIHLQQGAIVELVDLHHQLNGQAGKLAIISQDPAIDPHRIYVKPVTPQAGQPETACSANQLTEVTEAACSARHLVLRLWDHQGTEAQPLHCGGLVLRRDGQVPPGNAWLRLEDDIEINFSSTGELHVGDYWLIPVRAARAEGKGDVIWPRGAGQSPEEVAYQPPHGTTHNYAPLALLTYEEGKWTAHAYPGDTFRTAPQLTSDVDSLVTDLEKAKVRITKLEEAVCKLDHRVCDLEEAVERLKAQLAVQRTQLYQDLPSMEPLEIGTVVALSQQWHDHVEPTTLGNERLLFGVVMEFVPDLYPNERYRIAMQGRTQCKVVGVVEAGDLLVACHMPGHARKAGIYLQPGTVIGKALQSFHCSNGQDVGLIDILVTLS